MRTQFGELEEIYRRRNPETVVLFGAGEELVAAIPYCAPGVGARHPGKELAGGAEPKPAESETRAGRDVPGPERTLEV